jgi:ABC-2 type transport system permease protein
MNRMFAIVEREMRKFFRSPALMMVSMTLPLVQLIILGNAFGGKIRNARMGVVDYDHGSQALRIHEAFDSVRANIGTFTTLAYDDEVKAREDVRTGKIDGAVIIPPQYSRRVMAHDSPSLGLVVDNTDQTMSGSLEAEMQSLVDALNAPTIQPLVVQQITLKIVELYPYVEYMKYLLAGSISLAMYVAVMIGGGMLYIDDKARGVHEGYLVTPITRLELVLGLNLAGAIKAVLSGISLTVIGTLLAGLGVIFSPMQAVQLSLLIVATSVAFNGMMFLMMVRVEDPEPSHPWLVSQAGCEPSPLWIHLPTPFTASSPFCSKMEALPLLALTSSFCSPSASVRSSSLHHCSNAPYSSVSYHKVLNQIGSVHQPRCANKGSSLL